MKNGLEALKFACSIFLEDINKDEQLENQKASQASSVSHSDSQSSSNNFASLNIYNYTQEDKLVEANQNNEARIFARSRAIEREIGTFASLVGNKNVVNSTKANFEFWKENQREIPILFELQLILLNVPATSSFIERFFSIAGIVCDIKRLNMTDELIIERSLMKANIEILKELNVTNEIIDE